MNTRSGRLDSVGHIVDSMVVQMDGIENSVYSLAGRVDALVQQLDNMGDNSAAMRRRIEAQHRVASFNDSMRPLGEPFQGVNLTGECVELTVHCKFDIDGLLEGSTRDDRAVIFFRDRSFEEICLPSNPKLKAVRQRIPSVRSFGHTWVVLSCNSLDRIVEHTNNLLMMFGHPPSTHMEIHCLPRWQVPVALAFMMGSGEDEAWQRLTDPEQQHIKSIGSSFWTKYGRGNVLSCVKDDL